MTHGIRPSNESTRLSAARWLVMAAAWLLAACSGAAGAPTQRIDTLPATLDPNVEPTEFLPTLAPTQLLPATPTLAATATPQPASAAGPTAAPTLRASQWQQWPVVPVVSPRMRLVYEQGLELGNSPRAFAKVGDCQNVASYFLAVFERPEEYRLGAHAHLQDTIDYFNGSFARESVAVQGGYNVASVLSPFWADPALCEKDENPLQCEYRLQKPSFAIISMETWWSGKPASEYEGYLRQIVEYSLAQGTIPILGTKADNWEGDHAINAAIARVAADYEVPLWNFWAAVQPLPDHGLTVDGFHLTYARNFFDDPVRMQSAWPVRNLTALQTLDAVRRFVAAAD